MADEVEPKELAAFLRNVTEALRSGRLEASPDTEPGQANKTLLLPGTTPVVIRTRGDGELEKIPISEVAALGRGLHEVEPALSDEELKRSLLAAYERVRLTANASAFLDRCLAEARA